MVTGASVYLVGTIKMLDNYEISLVIELIKTNTQFETDVEDVEIWEQIEKKLEDLKND